MKILLVDDDSGVVEALLAILKNVPAHEVRAATSGPEALSGVESWGEVDLLITDVVMDPMDGFILRDIMKQKFPRLETFFLTGYDLSDYPEQMQGERVLLKPISTEDLVGAVQKIATNRRAMMPEPPASSPAPATRVEPSDQATPAVPEVATESAPAVVPEKLSILPVPPVPPVIPPSAPPTAPEPKEPAIAAAPASVPPPTEATPSLPPSAPTSTSPSSLPRPPQMPSPAVPPRLAPAPTPTAKPVIPERSATATAPPAPIPVGAGPIGREHATGAAAAENGQSTPVRPAPGIAPKPMGSPVARAVRFGVAPTATPTLPTASPPPTLKPTAPHLATRGPDAPRITPTPASPPANLSSPRPPASPLPSPPRVAHAPAVPRVVAPPRVVPGAPTATPPETLVPGRPTPPHRSAPSTSATAAAADLTGLVIGAYKIVRKLGNGKWGGVYEALQTSMNRPVALKILSDELAADPRAKQRFIANASAKAKVQHPHILSVYEAGETAGHCFYTHELVDGNNVAEMAARKATVGESVALYIVRIVAESLSYLNKQKIAHSPLEPKSIYVGLDQRARLSNLANWQNGEMPDTQKEISILANAVTSILPDGRASSRPMQEMLDKMRNESDAGFASWGALLQTVKTLEPTIVPVDAFKLSEQDEAAIRAVDDAKKKQKRSLVLMLVGSLALLSLILFAIWWQFLRTNERNFDKMVQIPAGEFIYQEGEKVMLPAFWIDQYEVTIGQYQKFLVALAANPTTQYDHPKQPPGKSHKPINWDIYYGRAKAGKPVKFIPIDLNCPMMLVDWWDAYAYAKWVGRRLPTEQEWEKAARGPKGLAFPWGDQFDPKKCNSNADYSDDPRAKGGIDGYNRWAPVDAIPGDRSEFGVIGTAGNVSEWTGSWDPTGKFPVIRGGSFHSPDVKITRRIAELDPERAEEFVGFRTASSEPPKK